MIESFLLKKSFFDRYLKINCVVLCFGCYDIAARQDCGIVEVVRVTQPKLGLEVEGGWLTRTWIGDLNQ